jgi:ABC-type multidrug transport system fused ATPase/permease subunit
MKVKDNDIRKNIILVSVIAVILYGVFIVSKSLFSIWGLLLIILIIIAWVIYKNPKKGEKIKSKVKETLGIESKEIPEYKKPKESIKTKALLEKKLKYYVNEIRKLENKESLTKKERKKYKRYIQAINAIGSLAEKKGIKFK